MKSQRRVFSFFLPLLVSVPALTLILQRRAFPNPDPILSILNLNTTPLVSSFPLISREHDRASRPPSLERSSSHNVRSIQSIRSRRPPPLLALPSRPSPLMRRSLVLHGDSSSPISRLRPLARGERRASRLASREGRELLSRRCNCIGRCGGWSEGLRSRGDAEAETRRSWGGDGWSNERRVGWDRRWRRFRVEPGSKMTASVGDAIEVGGREVSLWSDEEGRPRRNSKTREKEKGRTRLPPLQPLIGGRSWSLQRG